MVRLFVAVTDKSWFDQLSASAPHDEVNFWQPSGTTQFRALQPGELFLFKLHAPNNFIVGGGIFGHASIAPLSLAWDAFGLKNGVSSRVEMRARIASYRRDPIALGDRQDPVIGCRILTQPFFWPRDLWLPVPESWSPNIVTGKGFSTEEKDGQYLWSAVTDRLSSVLEIRNAEPILAERYGKPTLIKPRLGQGAFRLTITDSYERRCAVSGERTLPILDAAHIRAFESGGEHTPSNGLLLRTDIHRLFDLGYGEMIKYLRTHRDVRTVLVEKTDRLYRNLKDWVTIDELDVEVHLIKEGQLLSRDSRSSEKFVHGIKVLMAKNYIDNLSEEARKGMFEKAAQGIWPTKAPLGYSNVIGPEGKRIIVPDPQRSQMVSDIFEWYATGRHSLKDVAEKARGIGLIYRRTGAAVPVSSIHAILRNRLYYGEFEWKGRIYKGCHEPLVSRSLWQRVQSVLEERHIKKIRGSKWDFAFTGLMTCGHCGCALVGEIKKGRYVYYHCTGYKGKCGEPYVREEVIEKEFSRLLREMRFDEDVVPSMVEALRESHAVERREHEEAISRLQDEQERLRRRIHEMYIDKLDGKVDPAFYDRMAHEWQVQLDRSTDEMQRHRVADRSYLEEGVRLLELSQAAPRLFAKKPPHEKRRLLNFLLSNSVWKNGKLTATFRQPFDLIAETALKVAASAGTEGAKSGERSVWLGD